ncbi:MAG: L-gulono,4-lactone dehydrogenase [Chloroflexota bacterium]|jgi:FAD-linked oxidoreductase|nr:L-gulono,4-lactone dehydrogenase [Chloroflexota bacterium]
MVTTRVAPAAAVAGSTTWKNWGGNQLCRPISIETPGSEEEIVAIVRGAAERGERVKVFGAGHSFTDIACTDGRMLSLERYNRVLHVDERQCTVRVQSGITIERLGAELARYGLAQPNLGDIGYQSIAGAISTATHGTGRNLGNISTQVKAVTIVAGDGTVIEADAEKEPDVYAAARVSLGALGIISTVTLQCVPAFTLRSIEEPKTLDEVLANFDEYVESNDHFEFFWFPHTDGAQAIFNNRTDEPAAPPSRGSAWLNDVLLENHAFGVVQRVGSLRRRWIPSLNRFSVRLISRREVVDLSHNIFINPRLVRFVEMEYAIPREAVVDTIRDVRRMIDRTGMNISFPVEVRVAAADNIPLSTATARPTAYIAVHVFHRLPFDRYFQEVEAIMNGVDGRPHWGKMHYQTARTLAPRYPQWDRFIAVRDRLDPARVFANPYLERVLG